MEEDRRLLPLFLNESFRGVAISLLAFFNTIFVYKTILSLSGYPQTALIAAFLYISGLYLFKFLANFTAENLSQNWGLKKQILISQGFLIVCLAALYFSWQKPWLLIPASIFWGLSAGFYWFGWHGLMVKGSRLGQYGRQLGISGVISGLILSMVPFLGGAVINFSGYPGMFLVSLAFVFSSCLFLLPMAEEKTHRDVRSGEIFALFQSHPKTFLAYIGNSLAATIYATVFPLYVFLILKQELPLGGFFTISMLSAAIISFLVGRWVDIRGKRGPLITGAVVSSLVWGGRWLTKLPAGLLFLDVVDRLTGSMTGIPLSVASYEKAIDGGSTGRAVLFRETAMTLGSLVACFFILMTAILGFPLETTFIVAALASLSPLLIAKNGQK